MHEEGHHLSMAETVGPELIMEPDVAMVVTEEEVVQTGATGPVLVVVVATVVAVVELTMELVAVAVLTMRVQASRIMAPTGVEMAKWLLVGR
jgi:hypothetical protein